MTDPTSIQTYLSQSTSLRQAVARLPAGRFALAHCCRRRAIGIVRHGNPTGFRAAEPVDPAASALLSDNG